MPIDASTSRHPRHAFVLVALAVAGTLAAALVMLPQARGPEVAASAAGAAPSEGAAAATMFAPDGAQAGDAAHAGLPSAPQEALAAGLPPALTALRSRADGGDAEAAWQLASLLMLCRGRPLADDDAIIDQVAGSEAFRLEQGRAPTPQALLQRRAEGLREARARCVDVGTLELEDAQVRALRLHYAERAADGGHPEAQARYARVMLGDLWSTRALLADPVETARRHRRARVHLDAALAAGEPQALLAAADAARHGLFQPADEGESRAWRLAWLGSRGAEGLDDASRAFLRAQMLEGVAAEDVQRLERRADELGRCCRGGR